MTSSRIKPAAFQLVAKRLKQLRYRVPTQTKQRRIAGKWKINKLERIRREAIVFWSGNCSGISLEFLAFAPRPPVASTSPTKGLAKVTYDSNDIENGTHFCSPQETGFSAVQDAEVVRLPCPRAT
jgi:hypothetical protein